MLEAMDREMFPVDITPTTSSRRPFGEYTTTLAMHWDGTYRDRSAYSDGFWDERYGDPVPSSTFAKHLATN